MEWNTKYWDTTDQFFWTLKYVGLQKVSYRSDDSQTGYLQVQAEDVLPGNAIYTRVKKARELHDYLRGQEEILNHVLDIGLAIAPDELISELFCKPLGFESGGPFESIGREATRRYNFPNNFAQQDGLFVSSDCAVGVEYKLNSTSSPDQLAKYAFTLMKEENVTGRKANLGLLYVVPQGRESKILDSCGLSIIGDFDRFLATVYANSNSKTLVKLVAQNERTLADVMSRMTVHAVSWSFLSGVMIQATEVYRTNDAPSQAYRKLLMGMIAQIAEHHHTGVNPH